MQQQGQAPARSQAFQSQVRATQAAHGATPDYTYSNFVKPLAPYNPPSSAGPAPPAAVAANPYALQPLAPASPLAAANTGQSDEARAMQLRWLQSLQASANGQGPSAASAMWRAGADRIANQAQSVAASQPGMSPAAAARLQMMSAAGGQQGLLGGLTAQRAQEQQAAQQLYTNALSGVRGTDVQQQIGNRGLDVTGRGQDMNYVLGGRGQDATYGVGMRGLDVQMRGQDFQNAHNMQELELERQKLELQKKAAMASAGGGLLSSLSNTLGLGDGGLAKALGIGGPTQPPSAAALFGGGGGASDAASGTVAADGGVWA